MIIGIIGLGSIGMVHAKNLLAMGHTVGVYDPDMKQQELDINSASDVGMLLFASDAVVIASPSELHQEHIAACWQAGKPVLVEKPIINATITGPFEATLANATKNGLTVMCGNNMRYHPVVKVVKERMWELGGPYQGAWFRLHQEKQNAADPVILNWGAHEVDLALYLLDRKLKPLPAATIAHDHAEFTMRNHGGPLVHFDLSYHGPNDRCFTIHGPNASILADLDNFTVQVFSKEGREIIAVEGSHDQPYVDEMKEFIRRVEGHEPDGIGATGEEGLACLRLLLEAQKS